MSNNPLLDQLDAQYGGQNSTTSSTTPPSSGNTTSTSENPIIKALQDAGVQPDQKQALVKEMSSTAQEHSGILDKFKGFISSGVNSVISNTNPLLGNLLKTKTGQDVEQKVVNQGASGLKEIRKPFLQPFVTTAEQISGKPQEFMGVKGSPSPREAFSEGIEALEVGSLGLSPTTVVGRLGLGTAVGAGQGIKTGLDQNLSSDEVVAKGVLGGMTGLAAAGIFEGIGAGLKKLTESKAAQDFAGRQYNREFQPPTKEMAKNIESGFKTFGDQVSQVVDESGNPVYVGNYKEILNKAKQEVSQKGTKLTVALANSSATSNRDEVAANIVDRMQDTFGRLTPKQIKDIQFEVSRMPKGELNMTQVQEAKRMYDDLIPDSFWNDVADPSKSFSSQVKYFLRDNARQIINEKIPDVAVQKLNNEMAIAMDMRKLSASQIAKGQLKSGTFNKWLYNIIDNVIFNPAITTRAAQIVRGGSKLPNVPQVAKTLFTQEITK